MNFTDQFRRGIGKIARESLDEELALPTEEVDAVMAEPVAAEIEQEVVAPAADIADGTDAMLEAEGDADTLDNTAAILEKTTDKKGPGADVAGAEMASLTLERIATKYSLKRATAFSKESIGTATGRRQMSLAMAKEAEDGAATLRTRVVEGFKKIIEWITDLIQSVFNKRASLAKRTAAMQTRLKEYDSIVFRGAKIKFGGAGAMFKGSVATDPIKVVEALPAFIGGFEQVKKITEGTIADKIAAEPEARDYNPDQLGGYTMRAEMINGKFGVSKETTGSTDSVEIDALDRNEATRLIKAAREALEALAKGETELKAAVAAMNKGVGKLKTVVTGKEGGESADRIKIMARYSAVSKISGAIAGTTLSVVATALGAVEKSMAAKGPKEADKK